MFAALPLSTPPLHSEIANLKKRILKLRWIGKEKEAERLLHDLGALQPSEIVPIDASDTD
jgi:hypothetical protein